MKLHQTLLSLLLALLLLLSCGASASADAQIRPYSLQIWVGEQAAPVRAMQNDFAGNLFLSLADLSAALEGTPRAFSISYQYNQTDGEFFSLSTGRSAGNPSRAAGLESEPQLSSFLYARYRIFIDGQERRYYGYKLESDLFLGLADIQLLLDLPVQRREDGLHFDPEQRFRPDLPLLAEEGYFESFSAVLLADADTGAVLYARNASVPVPVASVSKLMTYLLLCEDVTDGKLSLQDTVTVSPSAALLSRGADGMVKLQEGAQIPAWELTAAMLLASSNECALALAEHLSGSEEAFVDRMNRKAEELGLRGSRFYNPHGLPMYLSGPVPAKVQNLMSAEDLLVLSRAVLSAEPKITDFTSLSFGSMPSLNYKTFNSNVLVFNLDGCSGLKTGSTNKAGFCLVATLPVTVEEETHTAVAVILGAESPDVRNQAAELLLRYARDTWEEQGFPAPEGAAPVRPGKEA